MKKNKINNKKDYDIIIKYRKNFKGGFQLWLKEDLEAE